MKKILCILFVAVLLFVGCDSKKDTPVDTPLSEKPPEVSENAEENSDTEEETPPLTKTLVVPEGYTLARIAMRLEDMGVCTVEEFIDAAQNGDYSEFSLISQQEKNPNKAFLLEGYLFPDTYEIYSSESPESIIKRMLLNNEQKYSVELRTAIEESPYTADEIIAIASIIQKEAYENNDVPVPQEMPLISSVLYNRLDDSMKLQCNVTATYVRGVLAEFIDNGRDTYGDYYNTYIAPGIPAGAICNPGIDAIKSAVSPADTEYLYFLTDDDKNFYYSETYEEHLKLVDKFGIESQ